MLLTPYYFNSRPSARGDREAVQLCREENISIHAPPRGATWKLDRFSRSRYISIHAPPRGATRQRLPARRRPPHFNSRPSARGDAFALLTILGVVVFQFTPLREGRPPGTAGKSFSTPFQFTPLREGRPWRVRLKRFLWQSFQFTPLREGRRGKSTQDGTPLPFQFTPLREGRRRSCPRRPRPCDFNSRPSARGDPRPGKASGMHLISIHAPPRGATAPPRNSPPDEGRFQFTPLREGRQPRHHNWEG